MHESNCSIMECQYDSDPVQVTISAKSISLSSSLLPSPPPPDNAGGPAVAAIVAPIVSLVAVVAIISICVNHFVGVYQTEETIHTKSSTKHYRWTWESSACRCSENENYMRMESYKDLRGKRQLN